MCNKLLNKVLEANSVAYTQKGVGGFEFKKLVCISHERGGV